jgi:FtsP/CotA-like multicopper oxidase with cupredoxin domain
MSRRFSASLRLGRVLFAALALAGLVLTSQRARAAESTSPCPRPPPGSAVPEPENVRSRDGELHVDLTVRNSREPDGSVRYCYVLPDGAESPTLRAQPGDLVVITLHNQLVDLGDSLAPHVHVRAAPQVAGAPADPCSSGAMTAVSTNLHFHGLTLPPLCHQDEVLQTSVQPQQTFEYRFRIPPHESPGLSWYHPHIHGFSARQVSGGLSGALIVEGIERDRPEVRGLAEHVLVIRDQDLLKPDAVVAGTAAATLVDREGDIMNTGTGEGKPARDLSVNFVPVPFPDYAPATMVMHPGEQQLWRVLNASSVTYLNLAATLRRGARFRAEWLGVVAIDGVPLSANGSPTHGIQWRDSIALPPGARAEFILTAPPDGVPAALITRSVDTGPDGENDPNRTLLNIVARTDAPPNLSVLPTTALPAPDAVRPWLGSVAPTRVRKLYFSEDPPDPAHPAAPIHFYLTVDGQTPTAFDPAQSQPNIIVHQGDVEDWIIENRSSEVHDFHIHQLHFQVVEWLGTAVREPFLRDTVNVPFYETSMKVYPSVRLRMDFRDPAIVGTFAYHCHLLDHEDAGMMGTIRVDPAPSH